VQQTGPQPESLANVRQNLIAPPRYLQSTAFTRPDNDCGADAAVTIADGRSSIVKITPSNQLTALN